MNKFLRSIRYKVASLIISLLDFIVPKKRGTFVFAVGRTTVFSGNLKATFDYFHANYRGKLVLLAYPSSGLNLCDSEYADSIIKTNSLSGLWALLQAECIVVEYCRSDWFWPGLIPARHLFVNLWHGIPIKKIGYAEDDSSYMKKESKYIDVCIASSHVDRAMMSSCFGVAFNDVLLSGYPRNDWLTAGRENINSASLRALDDEIVSLKGERRLVLYAPTYRGVYAPRNDSNTGVYSFSEQEYIQLKSILKKYNAILGIRPHLNKRSDSRIPFDDYVMDMSRDLIPDAQMLLYNTDVLVSDYSGIWIDYLLMNRPIIGFVHDWESYNSERGYLYDYKSVFPGTLVVSGDDFLMELERVLKGGESADSLAKRKFSKNLFHHYSNGDARTRLFHSLLQRMGS